MSAVATAKSGPDTWRIGILAGAAGIVLGAALGIVITFALMPPAVERAPAMVAPPAVEGPSFEWLQEHLQREYRAGTTVVTDPQPLLFEHLLREYGTTPTVPLDTQRLLYEHLLRENGAP